MPRSSHDSLHPHRENGFAAQPEQQSEESTLSIEHLAHELNSLLDGSLRSLTLAQEALSGAVVVYDGAIEPVIARLRTAQEGLSQMAKLLDRAMITPNAGVDMFDEPQPLEAQILRIVEMLGPLASEHDVAIYVDLTPRAKTLQTATLGPVVLNGLRNAIQACAANDRGERRVEVSVAVRNRGDVMLLIADTGCGPRCSIDPAGACKPQGHGLGLDLCRQIVSDLGGQLRLTHVPFGAGAILQVVVPLRRLAAND